eukprot:TRINITY_DN2874_c0_g2_i1.p1 TRINITY_DN2874_c0_g2~~TRINITY_DN2874_c0_g2_i1.p1  ORF type:complete len:278 (+),score=27.64 TRINITY_DN2874_c0_g2_i1:436-1269(+)
MASMIAPCPQCSLSKDVLQETKRRWPRGDQILCRSRAWSARAYAQALRPSRFGTSWWGGIAKSSKTQRQPLALINGPSLGMLVDGVVAGRVHLSPTAPTRRVTHADLPNGHDTARARTTCSSQLVMQMGRGSVAKEQPIYCPGVELHDTRKPAEVPALGNVVDFGDLPTAADLSSMEPSAVAVRMGAVIRGSLLDTIAACPGVVAATSRTHTRVFRGSMLARSGSVLREHGLVTPFVSDCSQAPVAPGLLTRAEPNQQPPPSGYTVPIGSLVRYAAY